MENLIASKEKSKLQYNKHLNIIKIKKGDKVFLSIETAIGKKLETLYSGPYTVISVDSDHICTILFNKKKL